MEQEYIPAGALDQSAHSGLLVGADDHSVRGFGRSLKGLFDA
jgi:hypothetical protein